MPMSCTMEQKNILVVEDEADVAQLTTEWILKTGLYRVDCAESFERALEIFAPGKYFAVLLDLHLGMSIDQGIDLAVRFRERDGHVIIAVITAWYPVFDMRLLNVVNACLPKPIDMHLLETNLIVWTIEYARRLADHSSVDKRMIELHQEIAAIHASQRTLREETQDLLRRIQIGGANGG